MSPGRARRPSERVSMSALGQKQTCSAQKVMSALPPIADMCVATRDVRFVPLADIRRMSALSSVCSKRSV